MALRSATARFAARFLFLGGLAQAAPAAGYDLNGWLSVGGLLAGAGQCAVASSHSGDFHECRGAIPFQPTLTLRPTESSELFVKLGVAAGSAPSPASPFALRFWATDLGDDVHDINGRWDNLLNAWIRQRFELPRGAALVVTAGVIDAADFIDDNAYANDEYTQFMNEALVNSRHGVLPAYDVGGALELDVAGWSLRGVAMRVGENADGEAYTFGSGQIGYTLETPLGKGHYRAFVEGTSTDFLDPTRSEKRSRIGGGLSLDQELGRTFGAFLRVGWHGDGPLIEYEAVYSGGIHVRGGAWGRPEDTIGAGYAFLDGGNSGVRASHAAELYYRVVLLEHFAVTADAQFMRDRLDGGGGPQAFVFGLRVTAEF